MAIGQRGPRVWKPLTWLLTRMRAARPPPTAPEARAYGHAPLPNVPANFQRQKPPRGDTSPF